MKPVEIAIEGLEVYGHHGLLPEERELGQIFLFDIIITLDSCAACESDGIEGTVDYAQVADCVVQVCTGDNYNLLERLASVVATTVMQRFSMVDRISVTAAKPSPPVEHSLGSVSVTVEQSRGSRRGL